MIATSSNSIGRKPKNYSRKITKDGFICSCQCSVIIKFKSTFESLFLYNIMVKYEIEPPEKRYNFKNVQQYAGKFKKIIELPEFFDKLDNEDYIISVSHFNRDGWKTPFPYQIEIVNIKKYESIKLKEDRRKKLINLKDV
jgi:hypothetical protein